MNAKNDYSTDYLRFIPISYAFDPIAISPLLYFSFCSFLPLFASQMAFVPPFSRADAEKLQLFLRLRPAFPCHSMNHAPS